jgi:hypothetical protein
VNPFTRFLSQWSNDRALAEFVSYWDRLEILTITVYKKETNLEDAAAEFETIWPWLRQHYGRWQPHLTPFWQKTQAAGKPTQTDPFQLLLDLTTAAAIQNNWAVMQHLPAAREALNQWLLEPQ